MLSHEQINERQRKYYYLHRKARILFQREYDKAHRAEKAAFDRKRRDDKLQKLKEYIRHYSQIHHLPVLMEKYGKCQICGHIPDLVLHHKVYDKNIDNCLLVCQSCHKDVHRKYQTQ